MKWKLQKDKVNKINTLESQSYVHKAQSDCKNEDPARAAQYG